MVKIFNMRAVRLEHLREKQQVVARAQKGSTPPVSSNNKASSPQPVSESSSQKPSGKKAAKRVPHYAEIPDYGIAELFEQAEQFRILSSGSSKPASASRSPVTRPNNKSSAVQQKPVQSYGVAERSPQQAQQKQKQEKTQKRAFDDIDDVPNLEILFQFAVTQNSRISASTNSRVQVSQNKSVEKCSSVLGKLFESNDDLIARKISASSPVAQKKRVQADTPQKYSALFAEFSSSDVSSRKSNNKAVQVMKNSQVQQKASVAGAQGSSSSKLLRAANDRAWEADQIVLDANRSQQQLGSWNGSAKLHVSRKSIEDALRARIDLAQTLRLSFETMHKRLVSGRWNASNGSAGEQWSVAGASMVSDDALRSSCGTSERDFRADHGLSQQSLSDWGLDCPSVSDGGLGHALSAFEGRMSSLNSMHSLEQGFSEMIAFDLAVGLCCGGQSDVNSWVRSQHDAIEPFVWKLKHVDPPPI